MDTNTATAEVARVHPFEKAGLGKAPFRCVGVETKVGPIVTPDGTTIGSPGQPMGSCQYCGTGISDCFWIVSADNKRFYVGCDCVRKTADEGSTLLTQVEAAYKKLKKAAGVRKALAKLDSDPAILERLIGSNNRVSVEGWVAKCRQTPAGEAILANHIDRILKHDADKTRIAAAIAAYDSDPRIAALMPQGLSGGYVDYCRRNAGISGMLKIAREIEKVQKSLV